MAAAVNEEVIRVAETLRILQEHLQCVICLETLQDPVTTRCGHTFCQACINRIVKGKGAPCPLCNTIVNRRGVVKNEKIRNAVQAVHVIISNAQKDIAEFGFEDVILFPRETTSSEKKPLSPVGKKNVDLPLMSAEHKPVSNRRYKVESWLMKMHTPSSTQESSQSVQVDESTNEDSDSEMVSVSQLNPDQVTSLIPARSKSKPVSAHIDNGSSNSVQGHNRKHSNKKTTRKLLTSIKAAPLNVKSKQQSLRGFMTPTTTSSNTNVDFEVEVPDPVVVVVGMEKENALSRLPTRSPGWSRVKKMKRDFHQPSKVLLSTKSKGNQSPVPSIEDPGSSDEQPCINLSLESPVLRKKARMNDIVNSLASEIETIERSAQLYDKKADQNLLTVVKVSENRLIQPVLKVSNQEMEFSPKRSLVQFLKLGSMVAKKNPSVPIYLRGSLEHLNSTFIKKPFRLLLDAQTQTDSGTLDGPQETANNVLNSNKSPAHMFKRAHPRRSEGVYSECDMDADTVLLTQPITAAGDRNQEAHSPLPSLSKESKTFDPEIIECTFPEDKEQSQRSNPTIWSQDAVPSPEKIWGTFDEDKEQPQHTQLIVSSPDMEKSPKKTIDFEMTSHNMLQDDLNDSCSSVFENRGVKHSRILHSLSDSSDSDVGVTKNQAKKRKTNVLQVLSDNEDSCPNDLDISIVDTSKIMANIEAQLNDAERMQSPEWLYRDEKKRTLPTNQVFRNLETFDEGPDTLSDASKTEIDSDGDSEFINPTPQKPNALISKHTTQSTQSDDIVPSSQPPVVPPAILVQNPTLDLRSGPCDLELKELSPPKVVQEIPCEESAEQKKDSCPEVHAAEASEPVLSLSEAGNVPKIATSDKLLFVCSSLPASLISQVDKLANAVGAGFSSKLTSETSHLIVRVDESNKADKTLKYLLAVAAGKWVVSFTWVQKCLEVQKLVPEEPYEAFDTSGEPGPQRSRQAHLSGKKLFEGFEFCCVGDFPDLSKDQMQALLSDCGASVVSKPTDFSFRDNIIPVSLAQWNESKEAEYNKWLDVYSTPLVQHEWVLECIGKFCVTSFSAMLLCEVSDEYLTSMGIPAYLFELTESEL